MHKMKKWTHSLVGCLLMLILCSKTPLQADCSSCNLCDGCGDAYRRSRVCQVAGGWVIGGVVLTVIAVAIFGKGCGKHHHSHLGTTSNGNCKKCCK